MATSIIKNNISKIIIYFLPVLYFLVAVSFYLGTYDSAQIKITLVQTGGIFLVCSWLILKFEEDFSSLKRNFIVIAPILLFFLSGLLSYFISPYKLASLNEFVRRIIYCGLALIIIDCFVDKKQIIRLLNMLIAATYIVCIYGVIQFLDIKLFPKPSETGIDPFTWRQAFGSRIFSTFGNPNFFGDFLVVMGPVVLALFLKQRKIHLVFLWVLITFCVIFSYSKGAWLGFASGLIVFAFLFVSFLLNMGKKKKIILISVMTLFTLVTAAAGITHQLKSRPDSSSFRLFTWISTWEMIKTNPVLGTGIGTFYVTYPAYRRPQIFFIEGQHNTETDHPEDEYLEVWYDEGIIGIGIFLLLLTAFLTLGFKNLSYFNKNNKTGDIMAYVQLGVLTALAAQIVHNSVCVSLRFVSSGVMLWMLIGLIGAVSLRYSGQQTEEYPEPAKIPLIIKRCSQIILLAMMIFLVYTFYGYFKADKLHSLAIAYSKSGDWNNAIATYNEVIKKNPSFIMPRYFKANNYNDRWQNNDPHQAVEEYRRIWEMAPNYVQSKYLVAFIYSRLWEFYNNQAKQYQQNKDEDNLAKAVRAKDIVFAESVKYFEEYKKIDPVFPLTYYRLAWLYAQAGDFKKAENEYKQHLLYPKRLHEKPHDIWVENWHERRKHEYAQTYINLGNLYYILNYFDYAGQCYNEALKIIPGNQEALRNIEIIKQKQK